MRACLGPSSRGRPAQFRRAANPQNWTSVDDILRGRHPVLTKLFRSFRQLWPTRKRNPIRKLRPAASLWHKPCLEVLEDRVVPSGNTELFGGLEFITTGNGVFTAGSNQVTATGAVRVGVNPGAGVFSPLLQLDDGVQFNPADTTGAFTTNGTVSAIVSGAAAPLLNSANYKFTGPGLLSSTYFALPAGAGAAFSVAGADFAASALHLSGQELDLQGSLTLPVLSGLSLAVNGTNHVAVTDNGASLTGLNVAVPGPTSVSVDGLSLTAQNLLVEYSAANNEFEASGSASVTVGASTLGLTLGSANDPGLVIQNGVLVSFYGSVTSNLQIGDLTLATKDLTVSWAPAPDVMITGEASLMYDNQSIDLSLGSNDAGGTMQAGIGFNPTTGQLDALNATVNSSIQIAGIILKAKDLSIHYAAADSTLTISGSASFELTDDGGNMPTQSVEVALGSNGADGLVINTMTGAFNLDAAISSDISIAGLEIIKADDLAVAFQSASGNLVVSG